MQQQFNVSLIQMDVRVGQPDRNFAAMEALLNHSVNALNKPDVVVCPEMWNTGYSLERIQELADVNGYRTKQLLSGFCRKHQVHVVGSISEKIGAEVRNTAYHFDRDGRLRGAYSKIHLFGLMDEDKYLIEGNRAETSGLDGHRIGMAICYDIRFPELPRKLALSGAKVLFVPAEWPKPRLNHWRTLLTARAIENQMFVIACNRVGVSGTTEFFGHSMVIDPWGNVLAEGGEQEQIVTALIDLSEVEKVRRTIPVFADRRPELY